MEKEPHKRLPFQILIDYILNDELPPDVATYDRYKGEDMRKALKMTYEGLETETQKQRWTELQRQVLNPGEEEGFRIFPSSSES